MMNENRKKLLLIEDFEAYKELFRDLSGFPFDKIDVTVVTSKEDFENVQNIFFDFCVIDWHLGTFKGDYYIGKVKAKQIYFITALCPVPEELWKCCNRYHIKLIKKPIQDKHIKYLLGYKIDKKDIFQES